MPTLITDAAIEPVSLTDFKNSAKVDADSEDALVSVYISAARKHFELITDKICNTQTWELNFDRVRRWIKIPKNPVQSVTSVTYIDGAGVSQILSTDDYIVDIKSEPARIRIENFPEVDDTLNALTVNFIAGYGATVETVPTDIRRAVLYMAAQFYEHRTPVIAGTVVNNVGFTFDMLTNPHIIYEGDY